MNDTEIIQIVCSKLETYGPGKWDYYGRKVCQGCEFKFVALDSKLGFKFREAKNDRSMGYVTRAFNRQKLAHSKGLAPPPVKLLPLFQYHYELAGSKKVAEYFGYVTALATNIGEATDYEVAGLEYRFHENGLPHFAFDLSPWNMGKYNYEWVGIDFGDLSIDTEPK